MTYFTFTNKSKQLEKSKKSNKIGFTLAEVLITLGIIGIVAALTLPSFVIKKTEKERTAQLKKVYSTLSQAFLQAVSENGTPDEWGMTGMYEESSHYIFATKFRPYLKLAKDCIDLTDKEVRAVCKNPLASFKNSRSVILVDGTLTVFRIYDGECKGNNNKSGISGNRSLNNVCGAITVDLNGHKLPNKNGQDIFMFYFTKTGLVPFGTQDASRGFERACNKTISVPYPSFSPDNMYGCAAWVIYNENMDYLHCDDLSWDGKTKCK